MSALQLRPSLARFRAASVLGVAMLLIVGCSSGQGDTPASAQGASFGSNETECVSTVLTNDDGDETLLSEGSDCFVTQVDAGVPVVWDLSLPTAEGDPIYSRYVFDGTSVWILEDSRADEFGSGEVRQSRCVGVERGPWEPVGIDCVADDSFGFDGFPEADR